MGNFKKKQGKTEKFLHAGFYRALDMTLKAHKAILQETIQLLKRDSRGDGAEV